MCAATPEYGVKGLLTRNLEHLSPALFAKVMDTRGGNRDGQEILAAWIAKEKLRDMINLRARVTGSAPCEKTVRGRLFTFYDWCAQHDDIPELASLARTVGPLGRRADRRGDDGSHQRETGKLNRIAKLEARNAYSFRNPTNQRRRIRIACNRGIRRRSRNATTQSARTVGGRPPYPG
jgi:transposase